MFLPDTNNDCDYEILYFYPVYDQDCYLDILCFDLANFWTAI